MAEAVNLRIARNARRIVNAQLSVALGTQCLMCKPEGGKAYIVSDPETVRRFLDGELEQAEGRYYYLTLEPPDALIGDRMLDRAFGKASQPIEHDGELAFPVTVIHQHLGPTETLPTPAIDVTPHGSRPMSARALAPARVVHEYQ